MNKEYFDELSNKWDDNYENCVLYTDRTRMLRKWLTQLKIYKGGEKDIALDIGCATGQAITAYNAEDLRVVGADISYPMVRAASRKGYAGVALFNGNNLPFANESFILAHMFNVIEFVDSPTIILTEINRVLKNDGRFLINIVNFKNINDIAVNLKCRLLGGEKAVHPQLKNIFDYPKINNMLKVCGFRNVRVYGYGLFPRIKSKDEHLLYKITRNIILGQLIYIECKKG